LHIEAVSHVVNWDLPQDAEIRAPHRPYGARGAGGKAISLVDESSALALEAIEKFIGQKIAVEWADDDLFCRRSSRRRKSAGAMPRSGARGSRRAIASATVTAVVAAAAAAPTADRTSSHRKRAAPVPGAAATIGRRCSRPASPPPASPPSRRPQARRLAATAALGSSPITATSRLAA